MFCAQAQRNEVATRDVSPSSTSADNSSDADSSAIHICNAREDAAALFSLEKLHSKPVHILSYNPIYDCVISADTSGMVEYWQPTSESPKPKEVFEFKSKTDLYDFKKVPR
jgi:peptidylprolyl isomerase domain and WD repeat-containing protein 1